MSNKYRGTKAYAIGYSTLISVARVRGLATYQGIAELTGLPKRGRIMARQVGDLAGEISEDEVKQGRPMLGALVVDLTKGLPGDGFFTLAQRLQRFTGKGKRMFWEEERRAAYETWRAS
jgi:hypothetical protein